MAEREPEAASILVVDDHADIRAFMQVALESGGYDVRTASEGGEAIELQRSHPADLLVTDIFMPGQEGFETIRNFKAEFPRTKIIVASAGTVTGMRHDFLKAAGVLGVGATLRKPFSAEQLLDAVDKVIGPAR